MERGRERERERVQRRVRASEACDDGNEFTSDKNQVYKEMEEEEIGGIR